MSYLLIISFLVIVTQNSYGKSVLVPSKLELEYGVQYDAYQKDNQSNKLHFRDVNFNNNHTTVFIIHGYLTSSLVRPLMLKNHIFGYVPSVGTVVVVSWLDYSKYSGSSIPPFNYFRIASKHVPFLADDVYEKLMFIHNNSGGNIDLIGHSLGAHVAGQAGRLFKNKTGQEIHKIIGLDPAGPYFKRNLEESLQSTDAQNVVVFHTNGGRYGNNKHMGTQDIFVYGGKKHPNCITIYALFYHICSHKEAWDVLSTYLKDSALNGSKSMKQYIGYWILIYVSFKLILLPCYQLLS